MDFRKQLYFNYVSCFKNNQPPTSYFESYYTWCDFKYFPFIKQMDRESKILELGCGPGHLLAYLAKKGFKSVKGIDVSEEQVNLALKEGRQAEVAEVINYLKKETESIDLIMAIDFFEHFTKNELIELIPLVYRSLKREGILLLQTVNGDGLFSKHEMYGDLTHLTILNPSSLKQLLMYSGFCDIQFTETGPVPKNIQNRLRLMLWRLIKSIANIMRIIETGNSLNIWTVNMICCCRKPG